MYATRTRVKLGADGSSGQIMWQPWYPVHEWPASGAYAHILESRHTLVSFIDVWSIELCSPHLMQTTEKNMSPRPQTDISFQTYPNFEDILGCYPSPASGSFLQWCAGLCGGAWWLVQLPQQRWGCEHLKMLYLDCSVQFLVWFLFYFCCDFCSIFTVMTRIQNETTWNNPEPTSWKLFATSPRLLVCSNIFQSSSKEKERQRVVF